MAQCRFLPAPVEWRLQRDAWVRTVLPTLTGIRARRIRALAAARQPDRSVHLLTVSCGHRLHAQRRPADGPWSEPAPMAGDLRRHPFSSPAAASRGRTVEVVFLDRESRLVNAWWSRGGECPARPTPSSTRRPPCCPGVRSSPSASAAAAAAPGGLPGRPGPGAAPAAGPARRPPAPHARFAAQVVTPGLVEVRALTH
ncbi:hypothetical protein ACGFX2_20370 [Streptomyces goshikiensis]|uniref:hypothetical protein n=1 Tax=Streptomyces goshikiensis TaxID=1942 RepID=UPI0037165B3D